MILKSFENAAKEVLDENVVDDDIVADADEEADDDRRNIPALEITENIIKGAVTLIEHSGLQKITLMKQPDEDEFPNLTQENTYEEPPFKKNKTSDDYYDDDLLKMHSTDIIKKFPHEVRRLLTFTSSSVEYLSMSTLARYRIPPARKQGLSGIPAKHLYTAWRARVFTWHCERKGLGFVKDLYPNRRPRDKVPYFIKTNYCSLSEAIKEELKFEEIGCDPLTEVDFEPRFTDRD